MESKQVQENVPVWLASDELVCTAGRRQRGTFKGRPVFVQTVATSGSGPDLNHTLGQLQYVCPHLFLKYNKNNFIYLSLFEMSRNSPTGLPGRCLALARASPASLASPRRVEKTMARYVGLPAHAGLLAACRCFHFNSEITCLLRGRRSVLCRSGTKTKWHCASSFWTEKGEFKVCCVVDYHVDAQCLAFSRHEQRSVVEGESPVCGGHCEPGRALERQSRERAAGDRRQPRPRTQAKEKGAAGRLTLFHSAVSHALSSIRSFATSCADTGLRCANVAKGDDNELGADFGLLLVGSFNPPRLLHNPRLRSNSCAVVRAVSQS